MPNPNDGENVLVRFTRAGHETPKAQLFVIDGADVWIPKSQTAAVNVEAGEVWISQWLAEEKGLEYE